MRKNRKVYLSLYVEDEKYTYEDGGYWYPVWRLVSSTLTNYKRAKRILNRELRNDPDVRGYSINAHDRFNRTSTSDGEFKTLLCIERVKGMNTG